MTRMPTPPTLPYSNTRPGRPSIRLARRIVIGIGGVVILLAFVPTTPVREDCLWIDAVSGARKSQTVWRFGPSTTPAVTDSPLAAKFRQMGLTWQPDWRFITGTQRGMLGQTMGRACGTAPPIYDFSGHPDAQRTLIGLYTDDELNELFRVQTSGTKAEQDAALGAAFDRVLDAPSTRPAGR